MTGNSPQIEICPFCKRHFKRLKSHLPYCKMAGNTDLGEVLPLPRRDVNSLICGLPNTEKKKQQSKSLEPVFKKENKKSKSDLVKKKERKKSTLSDALEITGTVTSNNLPVDKDTEKQIKTAVEKSPKRECNGKKNSEELQSQLEKKLVPKIKLAVKSSTIQKSRSKATSVKEGIASGLSLEPQIQSGKSTSESYQKPSAVQKQNAEATVRHNGTLLTNSCIDNPQSIHQGLTERIELVSAKHHARSSKNRCQTSAQNSSFNEVVIGNHERGQWPVKLLSTGAEIVLDNRQQIVTGSVDKLSIFEPEFTGTGNTENGKTAIKACTADGHFIDRCRGISRAPVPVAAKVKSKLDANFVFLKAEEYPKECPGYPDPKSDTCPSFSEALREKGDAETSNNNFIGLEKDTELCSKIIVTKKGRNSMTCLKKLLLQGLEKSTSNGFTSPERGIQPRSLGLEWFPELYPNYHKLGLFSDKQLQWNTRMPGTHFLHCEVYQGWNGYGNKNFIMKKSGLVGISLLLLGFCTFSCAWSYEHIKLSRWWKYH